MPIEPPNPNNLPAVDALRAALPALHVAAASSPGDAYVLAAVGHVGAALALLEAAPSSAHPDP
jgi:hypothetical protein